MFNKQPISRYCSSQAGFSLLELMVTLVVAGIMAAIAIPNFMNWLPNIRLKSAARDLFSNMQNARMMAIKENKNIRIQFDNSVSPGFYYFDLDEDGVHDPGEFRQDLAEYGKNVDYGFGNATENWNGTSLGNDENRPEDKTITFSSGSTDSDAADFNAKGLLVGNSGYVYIHFDGKPISYAVGALTSGAMKLRKWTGSTWE